MVPLPPPPQEEPAHPMPVFIGPGELPGFLYFSFQPNFSAPILYSFRRMFAGSFGLSARCGSGESFLMRNSTGSRFIFTARSSMMDSMPNEEGGQDGARNARAEPALTFTPDCFTRVFGTL